ncbi:MAG: AEC family transporter [Spirochaetes bacterium]|nr:AEC family transporter [Spirochaetota bacterium]
MEIFFSTLESVITLFGIGILGFWIVARKIVPASIMEVIPPLAIDIALPCLIFANIIKGFDPGANPGWWKLPLWWLAFTAMAAAVTLGAMHTVKRRYRREFGMSLFYQNATFLPLGIISGLYGIDSPLIGGLFIFAMFYPAFFFNTYYLFFPGGDRGGRRGLDWQKILNPVLVATAVALLVRMSGAHLHVPAFVTGITDSVGKMTIPLIMLIIGGTIYIDYQQKGTLHLREMLQFVLFKNLVLPTVTLGALALLRPTYGVALIIMLQAATPPVSAAPIVTERAGGDRTIVNQFMVASYLASLLTIPAALWLFHRFFVP